MSYRTRLNDTEIFGNNEYFSEWFDFLKSQGVEINEEYQYDGEITDVKGIFETVDRITRRLIKERHIKVINKQSRTELADLSENVDANDILPLFLTGRYLIENAFIFMPYQVYMALADKLEPDKSYEKDGVTWVKAYKLKDGETIKVHGG